MSGVLPFLASLLMTGVDALTTEETCCGSIALIELPVRLAAPSMGSRHGLAAVPTQAALFSVLFLCIALIVIRRGRKWRFCRPMDWDIIPLLLPTTTDRACRISWDAAARTSLLGPAASFTSHDRESLWNSLPSNDAEDGPAEDLLRLCSWNVQGISDTAKANLVRKLLLDERVDISGLQETRWAARDDFAMARIFGRSLVRSNGSERAAGAAVVCPTGHSDRILPIFTSDDGRVAVVRVSAKSLHFQLVTLYVPAQQAPRREFMNTLLGTLGPHLSPDLPLLLMGDFNFVEDPARDRSNARNHDAVSAEIMAEISASLHLVDVWAELQTAVGHTWHRVVEGQVQSARLDRIYVSEDLLPSVASVKVACPKSRVSDHLPVVLELRPPVQSAPPRFRLNSKLLKDEDTLTTLTIIASETLIAMRHPGADVMGRYLAGKKRMIRLLRFRGRRTAQATRVGREEAEAALQASFAAMNEGAAITADQIHDFSEAQARVSAFEEEDAVVARLAAKEKKFLQDEKSTRYFFQKGKARSEQKKIRALKDRTGNIQATRSDTLGIVQDFYQDLFTEEAVDPTAVQQLLGAINSSFSPEDQAWLDRRVTAEEVAWISRSLPLGKAPGPDGLSYELYRALGQMATEMLATLTEAMLHGDQQAMARPTFCEALIVLLPKKGDLTECKNWRPISLINSDYKIVMALLANRLGPILHKVIGEEQTGFVPGRSIFSAILAVKAAIMRHRDSSPTGLLLLLDLEKAYDRVNQPFLFAAMERFGLPLSWIGILRVLYGVSKSRALVNGFETAEIHLARGVRQGCPLSPMLFIFAIEPLACLLRASPDIGGVTIGEDALLKVVLYADDTTILLKNRQELEAAERILTVFERGSGAKINAEKSELLPLVKARQHIQGSRFALRPIEYQARLLGATIGVTQDDSQCWSGIKTKMEQLSRTWRAQGLSLRGKVLVAKTILLSQVTFLLHVQAMPDQVARQLDRLIALFIWGTNRQEFASRACLQASRDQGGLDAPSVVLWRQAIARSMLTRLSRPGFWSLALRSAVSDAPDAFQAIRDSASLPRARRPKETMSSLRPPMPWSRITASVHSLLYETSEEAIQTALPIQSGSRSHRKVYDVRWRCAVDCAVARHPPSLCPHCNAPDSSRHRFWECPVAVRERSDASRQWPGLMELSPMDCLLFPAPDCLAVSDALLWRLHLLALHKTGILTHRPAPLMSFIREFTSRPQQ